MGKCIADITLSIAEEKVRKIAFENVHFFALDLSTGIC